MWKLLIGIIHINKSLLESSITFKYDKESWDQGVRELLLLCATTGKKVGNPWLCRKSYRYKSFAWYLVSIVKDLKEKEWDALREESPVRPWRTHWKWESNRMLNFSPPCSPEAQQTFKGWHMLCPLHVEAAVICYKDWRANSLENTAWEHKYLALAPKDVGSGLISKYLISAHRFGSEKKTGKATSVHQPSSPEAASTMSPPPPHLHHCLDLQMRTERKEACDLHAAKEEVLCFITAGLPVFISSSLHLG